MEVKVDKLVDLVKTYKDLKDQKLNSIQIEDLISDVVDKKKLELKGDKGPQGEKGERGDFGPRGIQGPKGYTGTGIESVKIKEEEFQAKLEIKTTDGKIFDLGNVRGPRGQRGKQGDRGPQGLYGPQGAKGDPGKDGESFRYAGVYRPGRAYKKGDVVTTNQGAMYVALKDNMAPLTDKTAWDLVMPLPIAPKAVAPPAVLNASVWQWTSFTHYLLSDMVWDPNTLKLYKSRIDHNSTGSFQADYLGGLWDCLSDRSAIQALNNNATNILINALNVAPTVYRYVFIDVLTMRRSDTVPARFYKLSITIAWDGTAWVKNESGKSYFPGTADDIRFNIATEAVTNKMLLTYTTPDMAGVYDAAFSKMCLSIRETI
jgi:hypothetical protein